MLWGDVVDYVYLLYDVLGSVGCFLGYFKFSLVLILEIELWLNLLFGCCDCCILVYIFNVCLLVCLLCGYCLLWLLIGCVLCIVICVVV